MAEEALNLLDKLSGKDAKVIGRTNEKNGADRLVNGVEIQTKYYATGKGCVDACFLIKLLAVLDTNQQTASLCLLKYQKINTQKP